MSETVWVVLRRGIYDQGVFGVYRTCEAAEVAAKAAKEKEPDDYHSFHVLEIDLDAPPKRDHPDRQVCE